MSERKIKVKNPNKWNHGIILMNGVNVNIKAGSVYYLKEEDLEYIASISKTFTHKHLIILDEDYDKESINVVESFLEDKDIIKAIDKSGKGNSILKKFLEEQCIDSNTKKRIFNIAKEIDLTISKVRLIEKYTGFSLADEE